MQPGFYSKNVLMIGKCYLRLKKYEEAIEWLTKARDWRQVIVDDHEAHEEALKLLKEAGQHQKPSTETNSTTAAPTSTVGQSGASSNDDETI